MALEGEKRRSAQSGKGEFGDLDLLVGRPEGATARRPAAAAGQTSPSAPSPQPATLDDAIAEILETLCTMVARIDALQDALGPEGETSEVLARETAALTQAVGDARGALAKAAELVAARRDGAAEAAQALVQGAAALKTQGEALDQRLHVTGRQAEVTAQGIAELDRTASLLESSLRGHTENMTRFDNMHRLRFWLTCLAMAAASFGFLLWARCCSGRPTSCPSAIHATSGTNTSRSTTPRRSPPANRWLA